VKSTITLTIDHDAYLDHTGEPLTPESLLGMGRMVNEDVEGLNGYESWDVTFAREDSDTQ